MDTLQNKGCGFCFVSSSSFCTIPIMYLPDKVGKRTAKLTEARAVKLLTLKSFWSRPFVPTMLPFCHLIFQLHMQIPHASFLYNIHVSRIQSLGFGSKNEPQSSLPGLKITREHFCPCQKQSTQIPQLIIITQDVPKFNSSQPRIPNPLSYHSRQINMHYYYVLRYYHDRYQISAPAKISASCSLEYLCLCTVFNNSPFKMLTAPRNEMHII